MSIVQISKIQQRSGNLVDLPQLDEAELGWATDVKRLFIGKITPNENVEVLTAYSNISFSQLDGAVGNLNISSSTVANGQPLVYDGSNWVNRGGSAGGLITLGDVSNVKITGGATSYVLSTDGTGNLSWTTNGVLTSYIQNVTKATTGVVTTVSPHSFVDGQKITVADAMGMTQLNGNSYYVNTLANSSQFELYSDAGLTTPVNTTSFNAYAYTNVANTYSNNAIKVGNSSVLSVNAPVAFLGNMDGTNISNSLAYYIKSANNTANTITISNELLPNGAAGNVVALNTVSGLTANVYETGGRALAVAGGAGGSSSAAGSNTSVQYNTSGVLAGSSDLTFDYVGKVFTVNGNVNANNMVSTGNISGNRLISTVATGTAPFVVTSTTQVANLKSANAGFADSATSATNANAVLNNVVTTGTYYPTFISSTANGNYSIKSNANINVSVSTATFNASLLGGTLTTAAQPNITSVGTLTALNASGTSGIISTDSAAAASTNQIIKAINGTQTLGVIPRSTSGSYNPLAALNDIVVVGANSSAQGNANISIVPWSTGDGGIRITTISNVTSNINLVASNTLVSGNMVVTSNVTSSSGSFYGNGSGLTNLSAAAISGQVANALVAGTVYTNAQPNITSTGTLTSLATTGNISVTTTNSPYLIINSSNVSQKRTGISFNSISTPQFEIGVDVAINNTRNWYVYDSVSTATRLLIDPNGNVGIGTTTTANRLSVAGNSVQTNLLALVDSATGGKSWGIGPSVGTSDAAIFSIYNYTDSQSVISYTHAGPLQFYTGGSERMRVTTNGNLAIGTTVAGASLGVVGPTVTPSSQTTYAVSISGATGQTQDLTMSSDASNAYIQSWNSKALYINGQGNNVFMSVSGGNVGIGTTAPSSKLEVTGEVKSTAFTTTGTITGVNLSLSGNSTVSGNTTVTGRATIQGNVALSGANISLGAIGNVKITGGTSGYVVLTDGTGNLSFVNPTTIGVQPAGSNTQIQFNNGSSLGASGNLTFNSVTNNLSVTGNITSSQALSGATLAVSSTGSISGNLSVGGNVNVTYSSNIGGSLVVNGVSTLKGQVTSTVTTGTPPFIINSTTQVANLVADRAYPRNSYGTNINLNWSGQAGQPTWLWGGNDEVNMYVYNPSNFNVSYASNSGAVGGLPASSFVLASDPSTFGSNGNGYWSKGPNGVIEQWGTVTGYFPEGSYTKAFPIAFTDQYSVNVFITPINSSGSTSGSYDAWVQLWQWWATGFNLLVNGSAGGTYLTGYTWFARGL